MTKQFNARLPQHTLVQIDALAERLGMTKTQVLILAVDRLMLVEGNRELDRVLAGVYISVANGRAVVSHTTPQGQTGPVANWQELEDDALAEVEAQGGHATMSSIYECSPRLAARAKLD